MTQSRTHYIPVSGITIEDITNVINDTLPGIIADILPPLIDDALEGVIPDPAVFCPINGYDPSDTWVPPVEIVTPDGSGGDQILLLCDDLGGGAIAVSFTVSTGNRRFECLTTDMTVIYTEEKATNIFNYIFPTQGTGTNYIIRLSCVNPASSITIFSRSFYTGYSSNHRILQAKFYTPNIQSLSASFQDYTSVKEVIFLTNMNALTTILNLFNGTGIEKVTWPAQMNALTTAASAFQSTLDLKRMDFSTCSFNLLNNLSSMFRYSNVEWIKMPASLPEAANFQNFAANTNLLKTCILPTLMPKVTRIDSMFYFAYKLEGDFNFPDMPLCTNMSGAFHTSKVRKISFSGPMALCTSGGTLASGCKLLEELVMPTELASTYTDSNFLLNAERLKKFTPPTNITFTANWLSAFSAVLSHFATCAQWGIAQHMVSVQSRNLTAFIQPTLRVTQMVVGYNGSPIVNAPLTSVDIDFANSAFTGANPVLVLRAQLPTEEINRIYNALPTVTGKTIAVNTCPGFSGANHAIAQAKGWTVTGA